MSAFHRIGYTVKTKPEFYCKHEEVHRRKLRCVCCLNPEDIRRAKL